MASCQPQLVGKSRERQKIKIIVPFRSNPTRNRKFQKNSKKSQKIPLWLHFKPKQVREGGETEKISIIVPFRSYPTRNRKFQRNSKKSRKIIVKPIWRHFQPKQVGQD